MAKKEYSKGDVINIFGKVIGAGFEITGKVMLVLSRACASCSRSVFWLAGKHVDMVSSIDEESKRELKMIDVEIENNVETALGAGDIMQLRMVEKALNYSNEAYKNGILPASEIDRIDRQALNMAAAVKKVLASSDARLQEKGLIAAQYYIRLAGEFAKYHHTGDKKREKKAFELLAKASEFIGSLEAEEIVQKEDE